MSDKRKAVFVVMDGVGDRPLPKLGGKTPLQAAKTPVFDRLAKEGQNALMDVIGPGSTITYHEMVLNGTIKCPIKTFLDYFEKFLEEKNTSVDPRFLDFLDKDFEACVDSKVDCPCPADS